MRNLLIILLSFCSFFVAAQNHPNLILTKSGVVSMRSALGKTPLYDKTFEAVKAQIDAEIVNGIEVPVPKDLAGGYTHSRHKANFFAMQKAGVLFQITEDEKYAIYIRDMLLQYAEVFPTFKMHPEERSYATGKFFWQCLNDANWLVYTSQAYDNIYDWLDKKTVKKLNKELFRPYAEFISVKNPQFFNRIHNHSTWGNAGVGMIGLVMDDQELIQWALKGLDKTDFKNQEDNDGGLIQLKGVTEAGFLAQLDNAFSPDGYYTEGPYYQRYAMYPFLIFAQALQNKKPELNILNYRSGVLVKAVDALIDLSDANGVFFPINDAQKGMSLSSRELVTAISMAYFYGEENPSLLSLINAQGRVPLNPSGIASAEAISEGLIEKYIKKSRLFFDGKDGNEGAIGILRSKDDKEITLLLKYAKHGMGHGHFDRLGFLLYDGKHEVFQDYGSARWVNVKHKDGGGYLKENKTWAKQSIAHNSFVINGKTQFGAKVKIAEEMHGEHVLFDTSNAQIQVISAKEVNAYKGWEVYRTMAMISIPELEKPLILDVMNLNSESEEKATLELPFYYQGELMSTNLEIKNEEVLKPMGEKHGYQHLWKEASAMAGDNTNYKMTWFNGNNFYSMTSTIRANDEIYFTRIGANDPKFNLRRDPGIVLNRKSGTTLFAQVYEMHGSYDFSTEKPINPFSSVKLVSVLHESKDYSAVEIELESGEKYTYCQKINSSEKNVSHSLKINERELKWKGPFYFFKN